MNHLANQQIRNNKRINSSTIEVYENLEEGRIYCIGRRTLNGQGYLSIVDTNGEFIRDWSVLTIWELLSFIYREVQSRRFLRMGTFSFEESQGKLGRIYTCWGFGSDGILYRSKWSMNGCCLEEWSGWWNIKANEGIIHKEIDRYLESLAHNEDNALFLELKKLRKKRVRKNEI
jgi:hypothetical protein